ncbi:hypothetical protein IW261DRAFT_1594581 [Armillaria novae-zelandiae]|uniref:Uncharacterized protein n=1 Tax=Armillaria novae-zelandiae TaxID=153914 RepID=A0AA39UG32_9AGAR|nr:hypothetical protein IW261DRAFT_1594581 [Armillaria novae-zelandiae]
MAPTDSPSLNEVAAAAACFVSQSEPTLDDAKTIVAMLDDFRQSHTDYTELALCERQEAILEEGQRREALEATVVTMRQKVSNLAHQSAEILAFQDYVGKTDEPQEGTSIAVLTQELQPEADHTSNRVASERMDETAYVVRSISGRVESATRSENRPIGKDVLAVYNAESNKSKNEKIQIEGVSARLLLEELIILSETFFQFALALA